MKEKVVVDESVARNAAAEALAKLEKAVEPPKVNIELRGPRVPPQSPKKSKRLTVRESRRKNRSRKPTSRQMRRRVAPR